MSTTYTHAYERDRRQVLVAARSVDATDLLLMAVTLLGALVIVLTYAGVGRRAAASRPGPPPIDLRTVTDARHLEAGLTGLDVDPAVRRAAAARLFGVLQARRASGENLTSVAAVLRPADLMAARPGFVVRTASEFRREVLIWGAACLLACPAAVLLWRLRGGRRDAVLVAAAHMLTAFGFAALVSRGDPLRDSLLFVRYTAGVLLGVGGMAALSLVDFRRAAFVRLSYVPLCGALLLSVLLIVFGQGPGTSGAKVNLGPVQPIEAIRLLLALFLAGYFATRWELLRQTPRAQYVLPVVTGVGVALLFFFLQKDLGPALFLTCVFLVLYAVATGRVAVAGAGFALLAAGFYAGYRLDISNTLTARVAMWQSPWENAVRGGDQIAQSLWALATGGFMGVGPGLGSTRYLPAGHTDLVLAAVGEELGFVGLVVVMAAYVAIAWRGLRISLRASSDYGFFLAAAVTLFLMVPVLVMSAGILGLIPLTGVVTPFLSYGGSAMTANFAALGILAAVDVRGRTGEGAAPFRMPVRYLAAFLATTGAAVAIALINVQIVHATDYAAKPHVGVQADGIRRAQHNPRLLDLIRDLPRGTIYDRAGLPLATDAAPLVRRVHAEYGRVGITPDATCAAADRRCYPLGGAAFHVLGDATSRLNWSATNTSYVERDAQDRLRGFRDHRELVPALRQRYDPDDSAWRTLADKERDVRLTVDARLQADVARILSVYARRSSRTGRAAAVVLDPDTGGVLALASYPWPGLDGRDVDMPVDALLDRSRYGLYPPGSTFKLVTAIAALRRDPGRGRATFMCQRLPDRRVGISRPGIGLVRDDVLDRDPHGAVDLREGLVHSCNAYFAQLAMAVGPESLRETADLLGMTVAPSNGLQRIRATLPQAGYGQGDVVVTPLRMARVAAALAEDGTLREAQLLAGQATKPAGRTLLQPTAARRLAAYMREAVVSGTGRSLRTHPWRIAGKTGTAEVAGAPSHSWFVGFAPYGRATRRVAFAIVIENAGYGSLAAAPVAGEIVSAAAAAGLVR